MPQLRQPYLHSARGRAVFSFVVVLTLWAVLDRTGHPLSAIFYVALLASPLLHFFGRDETRP